MTEGEPYYSKEYPHCPAGTFCSLFSQEEADELAKWFSDGWEEVLKKKEG